MIIPLYLLLVIYGVLFVVYLFFLGVTIYHLFATDTFTKATITVMTVVIGFSLIVLLVTVYLLRGVDWTQTVTALGNAPSLDF